MAAQKTHHDIINTNTASSSSLPNHQPRQNPPQRLSPLPRILTQHALNLSNQPLRLRPQPHTNALAILETALLLEIPHGVALDLVVGRLLLEHVVDDAVGGVGVDGVDDGEAEFALG